MIRNVLKITLVGVAMFALALPATAADPAGADRYLVVFEDTQSQKAVSHARLVQDLGGEIVRSHPALGVALVESDSPRFLNLLRQAPAVMDVSPVEHLSTVWTPEERAAVADSILGISGVPGGANLPARHLTPDTKDSFPDPTTLPFWPFQWNMQIIQMEKVYEQGFFGDPDVRVALVGAGVDYRHPDLVGKVNLDLSKSFVPSDDAIVAAMYPGEHPVADLSFHTTHMATQITCNLTFLACVAPGVELVGVKVLDLTEGGTIAALVAGIEYAADIGSEVIVIPFSYWGPSGVGFSKIWNADNPDDRADIKAVERAVNYAYQKGAVVISEVSTPFAQFGINADEDGRDVIIPSQSGGTIAIGPSGSQDSWGQIGNYGVTLVDAVGPAGRVEAGSFPQPSEFLWGPCSSFTQVPALKEPCKIENQPQFIIILGSQPASGHAAGIAALIYSRYGDKATAGKVRSTLLRTAVDIEEPGHDAFTGHGRVDAYKAITE